MTVNFNKDVALKVAGYACTLAGAVISTVVTKNENAKLIEKAVENHLKNK